MITERVVRFITEMYDRQDITPNTKLVADLGLSSFQIMVLICEAEEHFRISLPLNRITNTSTVGELSQLIEEGSGADG